MGKDTPFFNEMKAFRNPVAVDVPIPIPSFVYRNDLTTSLIVFYNNVINSYVPRIIARITKYNVIKWVLGYLGLRHEWLIMLLLVIL